VVIGCGGVGMAAINGAQIAGAGRRIASTPIRSNFIGHQAGATDIVDPKNGDVCSRCAIYQSGVHHSFEVLGARETAEQAFAMLGPAAPRPSSE